MNMQWMREQSNSLIIMLMFGIIIVVFALSFGPGSRLADVSTDYAAKVNGQVITTGEWSFFYNQLYSSYQQFDPNFNNDKAEMYNLKGKALDTVIDRALLSQIGDSIGLGVADEEVGRDLVNTAAFQDEGKFDKDLYTRMVAYYYKMSLARYEEKHKQDMLGNRVRDLLNNGFVISDNAAFDEWAIDNEKVDLEFVKFAAKDQTVEPFTAEDLAAFQKNETEKIEKYFENKKSDYEKPEQVSARHILLKVNANASAAEQKQVEKKAKKIAKEAKANADKFAELASKYSEGPTKTKGGDLGFFAKGRMVKAFEDAAFAMKPGDVSEPVKTQFGWHIIKVEDKKAAEKKTLEDVKESIARVLITKERTKASAKAKADTFLAEAKAGKTFEELLPKEEADKESKKKDEKKIAPVLKLQQTGSFARTSGSYIPRMGSSDEVTKMAWELKKEAPLAQQVYEIGDDYYVIRLKEHMIPTKDEFVGVKKDQLERATSMLSNNAYTAWMKNARENADIEVRIDAQIIKQDN